MKKLNNLYIFSNDNFFYKKNFLYYQNKNTQTIIDILSGKFKVNLISKKNKNKFVNKKKLKNVQISNFFSLLKDAFFNKKINFFFISITPFNFFFYIILKILFVKKKNIYLFLRSDGFKEYEIKLPIVGYFLYYLMFELFNLGSNLFSCSKYFQNLKKFKLLFPSELDNFWFKKKINKTVKVKSQIRMLFVGRFRKEKGYLDLIKLFNQLNKNIGKLNFSLTLLGSENKNCKKEKNIKILKHISNTKKLINVYDNHEILILPSYTEGFPQVILESFARKKPVIVFNEIKFLKQIYPKGLFVSDRNVINFTNTIKYIIKNYSKILNEINDITLISKKDYQKNLLDLLKY